MSTLDTIAKNGSRVWAGVGLAVMVTWMTSASGASSAASSAATSTETLALIGESAGGVGGVADSDEPVSALPIDPSFAELGRVALTGAMGWSQPWAPPRGSSTPEISRDGNPPGQIPVAAYCCSDGFSCFVYEGFECPSETTEIACPCPPF